MLSGKTQPVVGIGIAQDAGTLVIAAEKNDGSGVYAQLEGVRWADLDARVNMLSNGNAVVLIECLPNLDRARDIVHRRPSGQQRRLAHYTTALNHGDFELRGDREVVVARPGGPLEIPERAARHLARIALAIGSASKPDAEYLVRGELAVVTLYARTSLSAMVSEPRPQPEQIPCRVDQPLVFEGGFLRTYDLETGAIDYRPTSAIQQIRVPKEAV